MMWQLSASVIAEAGTALGLLIVAIYFPWRGLNRRASLIGSVLLIVAALWILTHSLEIGTPVASYKAYLMGLQLAWGLSALTVWLIHIIHHVASEKWQTGRIYALFGIMPLLTVVAVTTNHFHELMWTAPGLNMNNPYLPLDPVYGPGYWVILAYMGVLIACGSFLIFKKVVRPRNLRRWEPWILILAVVMPLLAAFIEVTGVTRPANLTVGITPFLAGIGVIALVWSLPRVDLQKVIPVIRQTVFERISDCVVVLNMQNRVVDLNPAAERLAGYTSSEARGLSVEQIWPGWPRLSSFPKPNSIVREELVLVHDGEQRTYNLNIYAITDHMNHPVNKVVLLVDITEAKRTELEHQQLRDKAEISSRLAAVGEMAAGIAHEINNPLTGVIGFSELLLMAKDLPPRIREQVKIIADGSQRVKEIVARMLTFARQSKPERACVSIQELIDNTLEIRGYVLKTANIDVVRNYDPGVPSINADPGQLQQVFLNLIVNAEFAMKKAHGKGRLTITTKKLDSDIRISLQDDGPGMSAETKAKLFHPFFSTKAPGEGTGLGLSISRSIILEHSGTIEVESVPGQGATFIVTLPVTPSTEGAPAGLPVESAAAPEKVRTGRILVVDDEDAIRLLVKVTLGDIGHTVDGTDDPLSVLQKLDTTGYDVILLDMRMPGLGGRELHAQIMEKHPELGRKVIFMTGDTSDRETKAYLDDNNLPWIAKPFGIEELKEKVDGVMRAG